VGHRRAAGRRGERGAAVPDGAPARSTPAGQCAGAASRPPGLAARSGMPGVRRGAFAVRIGPRSLVPRLGVPRLAAPKLAAPELGVLVLVALGPAVPRERPGGRRVADARYCAPP